MIERDRQADREKIERESDTQTLDAAWLFRTLVVHRHSSPKRSTEAFVMSTVITF